MQKLRQRALIADDVRFGKTIEAGLVLKEFTARNRVDRVLFVVPAHPQKKWNRDMDRFFDIERTPGDRQSVEGERRRRGEEANIWDQDHQRVISSMAFLRQDEFQPALDDAFWDVVIFDEAHKAAKPGESPSKTSRMVERVAGNSDLLLLLSATPHDGKGEAFRSLVEYIDPFLVAEDQELSQTTSSPFHSSRCGSPDVQANRPGLTDRRPSNPLRLDQTAFGRTVVNCWNVDPLSVCESTA